MMSSNKIIGSNKDEKHKIPTKTFVLRENE